MSAAPVKILYLGDSGTGKTGSLASLVPVMDRMFILDFDNGAEIIQNSVPKALWESRVFRVPLQDRMGMIKVPVMQGGNVTGYLPKLVPTKADAYQRAIRLISDSWKSGDQDLGNIYSWNTKDLLVIDSLTFLWKSALKFVLALNSRAGQHPTLPEWGTVQGLVEDILATIFDASVQCNVIVTAHIDYERFDPETMEKTPSTIPGTNRPNPALANSVMRGLPSGPGSKLNPIIPGYFNHTLRTVIRGNRHFITTEGDGIVALKSAAPGKVRSSYPIETGLADYFADLQKESSK